MACLLSDSSELNAQPQLIQLYNTFPSVKAGGKAFFSLFVDQSFVNVLLPDVERLTPGQQRH